MGVSRVPRSLDQALPETHTAASRISEKHLLVQAQAAPGSGRAQDRIPGPLAGPAARSCLPPPISLSFLPSCFPLPSPGPGSHFSPPSGPQCPHLGSGKFDSLRLGLPRDAWGPCVSETVCPFALFPGAGRGGAGGGDVSGEPGVGAASPAVYKKIAPFEAARGAWKPAPLLPFLPPSPKGHFTLDACFSPTCRQHIFQISTW